MPTVEDHKDAAKAELELYAHPDTEPALSDPELNSILNSVQRASFWLQSTAFTFGAVILPATKNGHSYTCIQAGTTGATEPKWPTCNGATATDGTAIWKESGPDFDSVFDVRAAIEQAWTMKAAKASVLIDRDRHLYSQIYDHCNAQAEKFAAVKLA